MTDPLPAIAEKLAQEVRLYGHCRQGIHDHRECQCGHCVALREHARYVAETASIQRPTDAEHALNIQLSALLNRIEQDGWARLDREDVAWLKGALGLHEGGR